MVPWPRLWPFLRAVLGQSRELSEPDMARLVDLIARGRSPRRLPTRRVHRWASDCHLILDLAPRLTPFHQDYWRLLPALARLRGPMGLAVWILHDGPDGDCKRPGDPIPYRPPEAGTPILILGDLGCLGEAGDRAAWRRFGRRLRAAGAAPVAFMPCPPRFWDPRLAGLFFALTWDRGHGLPRQTGGPRPRPGQRADPQEDPGASRLLDLLAPAIRLEPGLLRALRHALPTADLDVGAEAAAWVHPHVTPSVQALTWADQSAVGHHRAAYRRQPKWDRRLAGELIRRYHDHLAQSVRAEEAANLAELDQGRLDSETADYLARTLRTLETAGSGLKGAMTAWAGRLGTRQHDSAWQFDQRRAALWVLAHRDALLRGECELPPGLDLATADWILAGGGEPRAWTLFQQGEGLRVTPGPRADLAGLLAPFPQESEALPGSPLAEVWLSDTPLQYAPLEDPDRPRSLPVGTEARIPLSGSGILLRAHAEELRIEAMTKPDWALSIARDGRGLSVEVREGTQRGLGNGQASGEASPDLSPEESPEKSGEGRRRLVWVSPADRLFPVHNPPLRTELGMVRIREGAFWDERALADWLERELVPGGWAERAAFDQYGLYAELECNGIRQRMRWILPGELLMGSPADETDREDDERQHPVLLTRGFWLADTACTQALWQAVTGKNPSEFQGPARPVATVSWKDVQSFFAELNRAVPGLEARLPTEAEWEYACRAGTRTPFSFGETIGTDQVNYDGNYPYGDAEKGEYRKTTVEVTALPANDWGLYQMHGNVWEWCQDWYGDYAEQDAIDPVGPPAGDWRVVRGGGWILRAWHCRAAQRNHWEPGLRFGNLGFRLARGPTGRPAEPGQGKRRAEPAPGRPAEPAARKRPAEPAGVDTPAEPAGRIALAEPLEDSAEKAVPAPRSGVGTALRRWWNKTRGR